jgi:ribosomal protein S18 acetylase RimI-like enzyme
MADEAVTIRRAAERDEPVLRELWEEFEREVPEPEGIEPETWDQEWADTLDDIRGGGVFIADDGDGPVGVARVEAPAQGASHIQLVYVRERARRRGVTKALLGRCLADARERGSRTITLEVLSSNDDALAVWRRLGFREYSLTMSVPVDALEARLASSQDLASRASTHVQTDDEQSVERALAQFVPRPDSPQVSASASWIRVSDPLFDRDRDAHARLARELSERLGAVTVALSLEGEVVRFRLYERGRMVDEYLSVPNYYGALPKGDELALAANPTLVSRLTGADRDAIRRVARTAASPSELPPAPELYEAIARLMGLEP